jgi:hypothetical protein
MYWAAKSGAAGRSEVSVTPPPIVDKEAVTRHRRRCGEHAFRSVPLGIISNVVSRARARVGVFEVLSAPSDLHGIKGADAENREFKGKDELSTPSTHTFSETRRAQLSNDI